MLETARIEEVVGEFVKLKRSGNSYKGLSPFSNERNPSFYVIPTKGIYKCFSSGKGGNVVNFLMEHEHLTYPEAIRYLAKKYDIPVEEDAVSPEFLEAENEREALFQVTAFAQGYFMERLFESDEGKSIGLQYLKDRGFRTDTIRKFMLGYSPDAWDAFTKHALAMGYKKEYLEKAGLIVTKEDRSYDRFRGRVIFPVHNISGRVLGFGARILHKDEQAPKYLNSPESELYNKSQILYGLYFAKNAIIRENNCLLVEGYTDVISLHQAGIENVVASSGTSLTEDQIRLIKRYTPNITILYDGDPAGIKASFRGIDMVLEQGMNVRIVLFPDNEDPDSYVRGHRRDEVDKLLNGGAVDFIRFKTNLLLGETGGDPIRKAGLIKEIVQSISLIPEAIDRNVFIKECSRLLDMPEQALMNELNRLLRQRFQRKNRDAGDEQIIETPVYPAEKQYQLDPDDTEFQERDLIRLLLMYAGNEISFFVADESGRMTENRISVAKFILDEINHDGITFRNPVYQKIFDEFMEIVARDGEPNEQVFISHPDDKILGTAIDLLSTPYELSENWQRLRITVITEKDKLRQAVEGTLLSFKDKTIERMILELQRKLKEAASDDETMTLMSKMRDMKNISREINGMLGRVVTR